MIDRHSFCSARFTYVALAVLFVLAATIGPRELTPTAQAQTSSSVLQSLYYDKPSDQSEQTVKDKSDLLVLGGGLAHWMKELKADGYDGKILQYFLALEAGGPGPYKNSSAGCSSSWTPLKNTVGYRPGDFCKYIHPNESWFLHNSRGERLYSGGRSDGGWNYQMNPASAGWRAYARTFMARDLYGDSTQAKVGFEGIFLDNIPLKIGKVQKKVANATGSVKEFGDDAGYKNAVVGYLDYLNDGLRRDGRPLWGNLIEEGGVTPSDYLRFTGQLDGYMHEAWATGYIGSDSSAERWEENLSVAETTLGQGKGLMATAQGEKYDYARQRFALASYLLVSNGSKAYFRYANWRDTYRKWYQYDNYNVKLGAPKGKRYRSGSSWRRDFACGYVIVNPGTRSGTITQTGCSTGGTTPTARPQPTSSPGTTATIPGRIQAEDFASGGQNNGYYDTTSGNKGGVYRQSDVDIQQCSDSGGGYNISWIVQGEWWKYNANVSGSGNYIFRVRVAAADAGQKLRIEVDGKNVTGTMTLPDTGGWQSWSTVSSKAVSLSSGNHTIRVVAESGWFNLNYIDVQRQ